MCVRWRGSEMVSVSVCVCVCVCLRERERVGGYVCEIDRK
jgi:hypothetical protein